MIFAEGSLKGRDLEHPFVAGGWSSLAIATGWSQVAFFSTVLWRISGEIRWSRIQMFIYVNQCWKWEKRHCSNKNESGLKYHKPKSKDTNIIIHHKNPRFLWPFPFCCDFMVNFHHGWGKSSPEKDDLLSFGGSQFVWCIDTFSFF